MIIRTSAKIFSVAFHPLLMPTYLFLFLEKFFPMILQTPLEGKWLVLLIFVMTFFLPFLNILFFRVMGTIKDISMPEKKDRIMPFIFVTLVYVAIAFMFYIKLPAPGIFRLLTIIAFLSITSTIITFFLKISVHAVAASAIIGILLPLNLASGTGALVLPTAICILLAGLVMSSRLVLQTHSTREVFFGAIHGFGISFMGMIVLF